MRIAAAQARPLWLDPAGTTQKVVTFVERAAAESVDLVAFPETFLSGYPVWVCRTDGASFENPAQKVAYAQYVESAVAIDGPEIALVTEAVSDLGVTTMLGVTERDPHTRGTVYCSLVTIDPQQGVVNVHRKLMPTHDERLVWSRGDGYGLRTHTVAGMRVAGLSCWENWMPQARHALYADGEEVHVATWPGWSGLTADITRFIAMEGRVYSMAVSGLLSLDDIPSDFVLADALRANAAELPFDGGSAIAGPDGRWIVEPVIGREELLVADVSPRTITQERLGFDAAGHYSRPDVFDVRVDRRRHAAARFDDGTPADRTAS